MAEFQREGQRMKCTLTHYRKKEHTHEEFIRWIVEKHLPLAITILKKHGVLGYSLFITPASLNDSMKQTLAQRNPTWDFADFDCFIEYTIPDIQSIMNVIADPDWPATLKDQDDWVETSKSLLSFGYSVPYLLETGEVVNMPK